MSDRSGSAPMPPFPQTPEFWVLMALAAFATQVGALQTAPILIAVVTAFLAIESVKYLVITRHKSTPSSPR